MEVALSPPHKLHQKPHHPHPHHHHNHHPRLHHRHTATHIHQLKNPSVIATSPHINPCHPSQKEFCPPPNNSVTIKLSPATTTIQQQPCPHKKNMCKTLSLWILIALSTLAHHLKSTAQTHNTETKKPSKPDSLHDSNKAPKQLHCTDQQQPPQQKTAA